MFDPKIAYPSDQYGVYFEIDGIITEVSDDEDVGCSYSVNVKTEEGVFHVLGDYHGVKPKKGFIAIIRVYRDNDHRLIGWGPNNS